MYITPGDTLFPHVYPYELYLQLHSRKQKLDKEKSHFKNYHKQVVLNKYANANQVRKEAYTQTWLVRNAKTTSSKLFLRLYGQDNPIEMVCLSYLKLLSVCNSNVI